MKGLHASIYTNPHYRHCANGGISETCDDVTIIGTVDRTTDLGNTKVTPLPKGSQVFAPTDDAPAVVLVARRVWQDRGVTLHAEPADAGGVGRYMAGGGYIASSDSRFGELTGFYGAVSLHDRTEGLTT